MRNHIELVDKNHPEISLDGKGRRMDNVFIERLWRSAKYERIYLFEHAALPALYESLEE